MRKATFYFAILGFLFFANSLHSKAQNPNCLVGSSQELLNINNVRASLLNAGDMWNNPQPFSAGYQVLEAGGVAPHAIYTGSLWFGGMGSNSQLYVSAQTYRQGTVSYWPGPVNYATTSTEFNTCNAFDQHFKVHRDSINAFRLRFSSNQINSTGDVPFEVLHWPGKGNVHMATVDPLFSGVDMNRFLAPFIDVNNDSVYNPLHGDYPDIKGDQTVWWIMNDVGNLKLFGSTSSPGLGLEVHVMAYAWKVSGTLDNTSFYDYKVINKGTVSTTNSFIGIFVDPDLGSPQDDFVGVEVKRGIAYTYHKINADPLYGSFPPTLGLTFTKGILADMNDSIDNNMNGLIDEVDEEIGMTSFMYYNNVGGPAINGNPANAFDYYRYMQGRWKNGARMTFDFADGTTPMGVNSPTTNLPPLCETNFMFPGHSDTLYGIACGGGVPPDGIPSPNQNIWSEVTGGNTPGDRRMLFGMGPFTFDPDQVKEFTLAVVYNRSNKVDNLDKLNDLFDATDGLNCITNNTCIKVSDLRAPNVQHSFSGNSIHMTLTADTFLVDQGSSIVLQNTENYSQPVNGVQYDFQGYQVFQVKHKNVTVDDLDNPGLAVQVAQSDNQDGVDSLFNTVIDQPTGQLTTKLMVAGNNAGLERAIEITVDGFTQQPLNPGLTKYYLVVSYAAAGPVNQTQYLRSTKNIRLIEVLPQSILTNTGIPSISIKKISGQGSGITPLVMKPLSVDSILRFPTGYTPEYQNSGTPVSILATDLSILNNAEYKLEINSYLEYQSAVGTLSVGDTIVSLGSYVFSPPTGTPPYLVLSGLPQTAGEAVIERIIEAGTTSGKLEIRLIGDIRGRFTSIMDYVIQSPVLVYDSIIPQPFQVKHSSTIALASFFGPGELWTLTDLTNNVTYRSEIPMSREMLQTIPQLGLGILSSANQIGRPVSRQHLKYIHKFTRMAPQNTGDLDPVPANFLLENYISFINLTQNQIDTTLFKSGWYPYAFAKSIPASGPDLNTMNGAVKFLPASGGPSPLEFAQYFDGGNIMVVLTSDTSKWTRSPVLQYRTKGPVLLQRACLLKSYLPSLNKQLQTDTANILSPFYTGSPSRGMSWFPGYAIDLDKGERVHLMFSEDRLKTNGENLIWEPTADAYGGNSYIFITNLPYDQDLERALDSLVPNTPTGLPVQNSLANFYARTITWVGAFKSTVNGPLGLADTLYISADKPYRHLDGKLPTYTFGTAEVLLSSQDATYKGNRAVAFPNPASNELRFKIMDENTRADRVLLYNLLGTRVAEKVFLNEQDQSVGLGGLASGTYIYILQDRTGRQFPGKFVKE